MTQDELDAMPESGGDELITKAWATRAENAGHKAENQYLRQRIAKLEAENAAARAQLADADQAIHRADEYLKRRAIEIINHHRERVSAVTIHGVVDTDGVLLKVSEEIEAL